MNSPADSIAAYIKAKDGNRPHLIDAAFTRDAILKMQVRTDSISFPASAIGRAAIAETLVRRFNQTYENIYTFCIGAPPAGPDRSFSCDWLVAMSEKESREVRVGAGRYDWTFAADDHRVGSLTITIDVMETLAQDRLAPVMAWVSSLPYPWCSGETATQAAPDLAATSRVVRYLTGTRD